MHTEISKVNSGIEIVSYLTKRPLPNLKLIFSKRFKSKEQKMVPPLEIISIKRKQMY
jgi:hypothetical protein